MTSDQVHSRRRLWRRIDRLFPGRVNGIVTGRSFSASDDQQRWIWENGFFQERRRGLRLVYILAEVTLSATYNTLGE